MIDKPEVIHSEEVYRGWLRVRKDRIQLPNEWPYDYDVVSVDDGVAVLPFIDEKNVLLQYQYRHPVGEKLLELVQGGIGKGESPEQAAKRELLEETGYFGELKYLTTLFLMPATLDMKLHLYRADNLIKIKEAEDNCLEKAEIIVLPYEQVRQEILSGRHNDSALVAAALFCESRSIL